MRRGEEVVIDAPTALGKTYTVATEPWLDHSDVTDDSPVVHFSETREARDDAAESSRNVNSVTEATLKRRKERCPVARGDHDPAEDDDEEDPGVVITMDGTPASAWFDAVCDGRGVPFSTVHAYLTERNDQGTEPPCCEGDAECPAKSQWNGVPREDEAGETTVDVVHATQPKRNSTTNRVGSSTWRTPMHTPSRQLSPRRFGTRFATSQTLTVDGQPASPTIPRALTGASTRTMAGIRCG